MTGNVDIVGEEELRQVASRLPAHLQDLTDRARTYVEAASTANTRRAYASD